MTYTLNILLATLFATTLSIANDSRVSPSSPIEKEGEKNTAKQGNVQAKEQLHLLNASSDLMGIREALELERYIDTCISKTSNIEELSSNDQEYIAILNSIDEQIQKITNPRILFIMRVILFESWTEGEMGFETIKGRLLVHASDSIVLRLSKLRTQDAYWKFLNLKKIYGNDAGGSLYFKDLELKYFRKAMTNHPQKH